MHGEEYRFERWSVDGFMQQRIDRARAAKADPSLAESISEITAAVMADAKPFVRSADPVEIDTDEDDPPTRRRGRRRRIGQESAEA